MAAAAAFLAEFTPAGATLTYGSYLRTGGPTAARGLAVDAAGVAWLAGSVWSPFIPVALPTTPDAYLSSPPSGTVGYLTGMDPATGTLTYSTYLPTGSSAGGWAAAAAVSGTGRVAVAGKAGSAGYGLAFDVGVTAPVLTGVSSDTGSSASDGVTDTPHLTVSGTAVANATVTLYLGSSIVGTTAASPGGTWSYDDTAATLREGANLFSATATAGGFTSLRSDPYRAVVDPTAPAVAAAIATVVYSAGPAVSVRATDANAIPTGTTFALDVDLNDDGSFAGGERTTRPAR